MEEKQDVTGSSEGDASGTGKGPGVTRGFRSLEKLRNRVELAALEIDRLREENHTLSDRLNTIRAEAEPNKDGGLELELDEDPGVLRKRIDTFISAIDNYLGGDSGSPEPGTA